MTDERRYGEDEVSEIFALAASEASSSLPTIREPEGLTLAELQAVGSEVGLAPERVAQAAASLDRSVAAVPSREWFGAPVSVGRVVQLPREATDREWQFLLADLRETFAAKGEVSEHAGVREWSNGNLHAVLEETEAGHRLRLGTRKGNASEIVGLGFVGLAMAVFFTIVMFASGKTGGALFIPALFAAAGGTALTATRLSLPKWAAEREAQMEHIASRAQNLLSKPAKEDDEPGD